MLNAKRWVPAGGFTGLAHSISLTTRLLVSRRYRWLTLLVLLAMAVMVRLGFWQLDRLAQRRALNAEIVQQLSMAPLPVTNANWPADLPNLTYRRVTATGKFDFSHQIALMYQNWMDETPGIDLITPLIIDGGSQAILVDRGWVPDELSVSENWSRFDVPGEVTVTGFVQCSQAQPGEDVAQAAAAQPQRSWYRVDIPAIQAQLPYQLLPVFIVAAPPGDGADTQLPYRYQPQIDLSDGPHLGYAVQWYSFALIAGVIYVVIVRKKAAARQAVLETHDPAAETPGAPSAGLGERSPAGPAGRGGLGPDRRHAHAQPLGFALSARRFTSRLSGRRFAQGDVMSSLDTEPYVVPAAVLAPRSSLLKSLVVLFKLRIVGLLVFAAIGGAFIGAGGWPGAGRLALLVVTGGMAAAGASALNEYLERESDARMVRTQKRPLVSGALAHSGWVPAVAGLMILLPFNPPLTFFLLLGAFIYIGVYTVWLKQRTPLNIVVGGAAGSAAVLSGSAAVGHWNETGALVLAMLLFLWTPSHFWSLAIVYRNDYARGGIPMLPATVGPRQAAAWVFLHTGATAFAALMLAAHPALGWLYFIPVAVATVDLMLRNARLVAEPTGKRALSLFKASNLYLALILLMICIDTVV